MQQWQVGRVLITKVLENELAVPFDVLLLGVPQEEVERHSWLRPHFVTDDGLARVSFHGTVVDTGDRRILVDTCVGEYRERAAVPRDAYHPGRFLEALHEAGYDVDDIDIVVCTHLHFDHVGWNTRLVDGVWKPTFPNSRYLFAREEWDFWSAGREGYVNVDDTVRPIIDAGLADLVETDAQICAEVRLVPTPGHTPGHVCVVIESDGERAVITGDLAHHPIQFAQPTYSSPADNDTAAAIATHKSFLGERTDDRALVIGTHFGGATAGRVELDGDGWRLSVV